MGRRHLLTDVVGRKPKDLALAIRTFVNRTDMLRECCFRHIGAMLVRLLSADADDGPDNGALTVVPAGPSWVTEKQAIAIGSTIVSRVHRSLGSGMLLSGRLGSGRLGSGRRDSGSTHLSVRALKTVVESHDVLRAMESQYAWFVPMLEVLTVPKPAQELTSDSGLAAKRRSWTKRSSSVIPAEVPSVSPSDGTVVSNSARDDEGRFSSPVWPMSS